MRFIMRLDESILDFISDNFSDSFLNAVMPVITAVANGGILYIMLAIALICFKKTRRYGIMFAIALSLGLIFGNLLLKNLIQRPRPFFGKEIELLIKPPQDYSFPSGHTLASFEMTTVMFHISKKLGTAMLILALLIAFSRLYLYVHFPTDVLFGAILGILFGYAAVRIVEYSENKYPNKLLK